mgnify:CR=1 FL=1
MDIACTEIAPSHRDCLPFFFCLCFCLPVRSSVMPLSEARLMIDWRSPDKEEEEEGINEEVKGRVV